LNLIGIARGNIGYIYQLYRPDTEAHRGAGGNKSEKERLAKSGFCRCCWCLIGIVINTVPVPFDSLKQTAPSENDVRIILWNLRHLDMLGQIVILLAGAFGVVSFI